MLSGFLETRLLTYSLEDAKKRGYEALSYAWQGEEPSHPILVDGKRFIVTSNLHALLLARRRCLKRIDRVVWADAICINQADTVVEKPAQLLMMKDIYTNSSRVIGWLGDSWDSGLAADMITTVDVTHSVFGGIELQDHDRWRFIEATPRWQALVQTIRNPYFGRAWICQEVVLGHNFQFYIGGYYIPGHKMAEVISHVGSLAIPSLLQFSFTPTTTAPVSYGNMDNIMSVFALRVFGNSQEYPLAILLSMFARLDAGIPRDKIYALLGLSNTRVSQRVIPSYTQHQDVVFRDLAILLLASKDDAAAVLPHAGIGYLETAENLPSWVPDWSIEVRKRSSILAWHFPKGNLLADFSTDGDSSLLPRDLLPKAPIYYASRDSGHCFSTSGDKKFLSLKVLVIDVIADVSAPLLGQFDGSETTAWYRSVAGTFQAMSVRSPQPQPTDIDRDAFWRTLIGDRTRDKFPAPQSWQDYYDIFEESMFSWPLSHERLEYWKQRVDRICQPDRNSKDPAFPVLNAALSYYTRLQNTCTGRSFSTTRTSRMGLVPPKTCPEDLVCIVAGLQTPYILRPHPTDPGVYLLVGECYMHGVMSGEMMTPDTKL
ncbi:hypothetical protein LTR56_020501, partial [Elasticomyces elasticus]